MFLFRRLVGCLLGWVGGAAKSLRGDGRCEGVLKSSHLFQGVSLLCSSCTSLAPLAVPMMLSQERFFSCCRALLRSVFSVSVVVYVSGELCITLVHTIFRATLLPCTRAPTSKEDFRKLLCAVDCSSCPFNEVSPSPRLCE